MEEKSEHSSRFPIQRTLELNTANGEMDNFENVMKALASSTRIEILRFLGSHTCSLLEIAEAMGMPQSTCTMHINILENAGLIKTNLQPAKRGVQKTAARLFDQVVIQLPMEKEKEDLIMQCAMPLGAYVDLNVVPTCGLVSEKAIIGQLDDPSAFYEPDHIQAQLIWFHSGYIEYRFPNHAVFDAHLERLEVSFEVCSEAPLHHPNWPSDITVWINDIEIGSWTSPADFGGERGMLTPNWWDIQNTQFGLLKIWKVSQEGSFVDGVQISSIKLDDLKLDKGSAISVRIGIKADAKNIGGINLFGSKFGNYPQDIILRQTYK